MKDFNLNIDLKKQNYNIVKGLKQYDNLSILYIKLLQDSLAFNLTGLTLRINFKRPDGSSCFQDETKGVAITDPINGELKIELLSSILEKSGVINADISVFKGNKKLTSSTFKMQVEESVYQDNAIVGADGKDLLQEIIFTETTRESNEGIRKSNEVIREEDESTRKDNEVVRESNEGIRKTGYSKMDTRIDNLVLGQGSATEVIDARLDGITNKLHPTLKARLDDTSNQLTQNSLATLTTSAPVTSLENSTDGIMQVESVKGRTLQNLCSGDFVARSPAQMEVSKNKIIFKKLANIPEDHYKASANIPLVKPNTQYTVTLNITGADGITNDFFLSNPGTQGVTGINGTNIKLSNGFNVIKFTSKPNFDAIPSLYFYLGRIPGLTKDVIIENVILLEGDYTLNPPSFFEGIKSTGELESNKLEVLSRGKNLFDKSKNIVGSRVSEVTGGIYNGSPGDGRSDYIKTEPNTNYVINGFGQGLLPSAWYDADKNFIKGYTPTPNQATLSSPSNASFLRISTYKLYLDTIQIEKGTIATPYEPYKQDKSEILLKEPFRGLPNGGVDEIIGGKLHKRIGKEILNGSENWQRWVNSAETTVIGFNLSLPSIKKESLMQSDKFIFDISISIKDKECITSGSNSGGVYIKILKSKLTTPDLAGFKKWLSENPTEVYYELETPIISTINPTSLKSFKDGSIILNNAIPPTISLKYPTSVSGRISSLESTLDNTVDRTKKLEEGLFTTVAQTIDNKDKIEVLNNANIIDKKAISDNKIDVEKIKTEITNARKGKIDLKTKIDEIDTNISNTQLEITNARNGKANLKTEIDEIKSEITPLKNDNTTNKIKIANLETAVGQVIPVAPTKITLSTWNIYAGRGNNDVNSDLYLTAQRNFLEIQKTDIVALQEVDIMTERSLKVNQLDAISAGIFNHKSFFNILDHEGGQFGLAFGSKFRILESNGRTFTRQNNIGEKRGCLINKVSINGIIYYFYTIHLDYQDYQVQLAQLTEIKGWMDSNTDKKILLGDFNSSAGEINDIINPMFNGNGYIVLNQDIPTYNKTNDGYRVVDNIVVSTNVNYNNFKVVNTTLSDHSMLSVDIIL